MGLSINLRFDLKRLSDEDLATRFESTLSDREVVRRSPLRPSTTTRRGPIRHPAGYRFLYMLGGVGSAIEIAPLILLAFVTAAWFRRWALDSAHARAYLLECEALDLLDEMKRRVAVRRRADT